MMVHDIDTTQDKHATVVVGYLEEESVGVALVCECGWAYHWDPRLNPTVAEVQRARSDHFAELFMGSLERNRTRPRPVLAPAPEGFVQGRDDPGEDRT